MAQSAFLTLLLWTRSPAADTQPSLCLSESHLVKILLILLFFSYIQTKAQGRQSLDVFLVVFQHFLRCLGSLGVSGHTCI